jgi:hypothetical protein
VNRYVRAAIAAGTASGAPSTVWALARGRPVTEAACAAGQLLGRPTLERGLAAHVAITCWWTAVLVRALPRRRRVAWGAAAGAAIHVLDMELIGRHVPHVRDLAWLPQLADHVAFGALVGWTSAPGEAR